MTLLLVIFYFSDYVCTSLLQTIVFKCGYVPKKCKHFYTCSSPNNKCFLQLPAFSCCFHLQHYLLALPSTHFYWHISQIIITPKGELSLSKCNWILAGSYPLSPPFPFHHNYTCRRVKWSEHGGMGPMQHSLAAATPLKSQKILFKARALGWNLIHRRLNKYISASFQY